MKNEYLRSANASINRVRENISSIIFIAPQRLEYILATLVAGGHILLADTHGVGKTSLARALAHSIDWRAHSSVDTAQSIASSENGLTSVTSKQFSRIQGTVDLLPQDILGFNRYNNANQSFEFQPGPIFSNILLCDEINLLTPKTQGAFLQAMEEKSVTVEGVTYQIPHPFLLIATMNLEGEHLFKLPLPQLDRFAIQLSIGYPNDQDEKSIILTHGIGENNDAKNPWQKLSPVVEVGEVLAWQHLTSKIEVHDKVIEYIVRFIRASRQTGLGLRQGLSSRAGIKISQLARALALVRGEDFVTIDHVKELLLPVFAHRIVSDNHESTSVEKVLQKLEQNVVA